MRIAHIVLPNASDYDRKSQKIDRAGLAASHEIIETTFEKAAETGAVLAHVYGPAGFTTPRASQLPLPFVASNPPRAARWNWPRRAMPSKVAGLDELPEAVEETFFDAHRDDFGARVSSPAHRYRVGTFDRGRPGVRNMVEQSLARIQRFREDVEWHLFDSPPTPDDLATVDAWCDPATSADDFDGFAAEAVVAGKVVVASRVPINEKRLEKGRTGLLVPPNDPNELTHAILSALFKSEVAEMKIEAARQTAGKFRPRQRLRVLEGLYQSLIR
ncbi:MAG TPA: glycosyltransferase [Thermoanaerobaculia bacterium]